MKGDARMFFIGMMWGAFVIAAMDYGDIWICAGDCRSLIETAQMVVTPQ